ncbi:MAG TPA: SulP family inorganic anion transporter [Chitinophagaceae bacterium]|nr:SulP family inorganic anion transporter [Chitinophagaceae bacterium]
MISIATQEITFITFMKNKLFANLKSDLPSGIVVFLVALPLCLGIALASGAPFFSGMIAGIIGGLVIASFSNSSLSVSGPAAGLAAIVYASIQEMGAFETFLLAVVFAGIVQFVLGMVKAGAIANYFPSSVIKGMLTAIGIIIILKQIPHAFGYDKDAEGDMNFLQVDGENTFSGIINAIGKIHLGATLVTIISLGILVLWEKNKFLRNRMKLLPGGLVVVIFSIIVNELWRSSGSSLAITNQEHLVNVPVAGSVQEFFGLFTLPDFSQIFNPQVYIIGLTIAAVASIETLLCIEAVDKLDPERRRTSTNKELIAQGIGNTLSGLIGGLPITSVIVRSSANVNAGAKTKMSAIIHGFLLLACTALIPVVLNKIPLAALAGILLMVGYKLAKPSLFKQMFAAGKYQWVPFVVTVIAIVMTDLLVGVGIGLGVSTLALLYGNYKNSYFFHKEQHQVGEVIHIHLSEEVSFLNKASIKLTLDHIPENSKVVIDASASQYIDYDVLEEIKEFKEVKAPLKNIECLTVGFKEKYRIENSVNVSSLPDAKSEIRKKITTETILA